MCTYNKIKFSCFQVLLCLFWTCGHAEEEIVVRLATETKLLPCHIAPIQGPSSDFSKEFLEKLQATLSFDMNYNGMTEIVGTRTKPLKVSLGDSLDFDSPCDFQKCKDAEIFYLIKMKMEGKNLVTKVISINGQSVKLINGVLCTGDIAQDRKTIHRLHDSIFQMLFQKPGIASRRILYTVKHKIIDDNNTPDWTSEVFESDYDGQNSKQLTHENTLTVTPCWVSPSSQSSSGALVYVSYKIGQPKIYYASTKDGKPRRLTPLRGNQLTPQASLDGSKIAFSCDATGQADLFVVPFHPTSGALGKPRQIYMAKGTTCASPTFSPDGKKIAFVANKDGSPKIYMMEIPPEGALLKDLNPTLISKRCRENSSPSWSPDGKKIAYSSKSDGSRQIWIYDFETGSERQLTEGSGDKENPTWASDSLHLLFNSSDKKSTEIYLINLNARRAVKITDGPGEKRFPYWK
jgi:TolB protein